MTPMTAGGICELLFEKDNGLCPAIMSRVKMKESAPESPKTERRWGNAPRMKMRKLRQAQFGIGGSNPPERWWSRTGHAAPALCGCATQRG